VLVTAVGLLFYSEFITYSTCFEKWPKLDPRKEPAAPAPVSILLVADPQIVGEQDEPWWPVGAITRWDCDW
jgi:hypothetical protein